jgi:hypothetical protein
MNELRLPICELIETQLQELGLRRSELARRCGFKNVNKGIRRIDAVCSGEFCSLAAGIILGALPTALEVDDHIVNNAVRETVELVDRGKQIAATERETVWRASFKPGAYLCGTETRPSSITIYGFSGGAERWLKIPIDCSKPPVTYAKQAFAVVCKTLLVDFFGPTTGYVVNYTPDCRRAVIMIGAPKPSSNAVGIMLVISSISAPESMPM